MLLGIFLLATQGTFSIESVSIGFIYLLIVPFLWITGHTITKPYLERNILDPLQVILFRIGFVSIALSIFTFRVFDLSRVWEIIISPPHLISALAMGVVYFFIHISWYKTITTIKISLASALIIPAPAITTLFAVFFLGDPLLYYQVLGMIIMFAGLYLLLYLKTHQSKSQSAQESLVLKK